jgi:tetratricopeptide (TPR) repeat protein
VAILGLLVAGTTVSTWQAVRATRAEDRASTALVQMTAAQARTRDALDALTDDVVQTMFSRQPELDEPARAFLQKVTGFYEEFTQESAETADGRFLRAKGYYQVAAMRGLLGNHQEAVAGNRQAESLLEQLASEFPDAAVYRDKLARTEGAMAYELAMLGNAPASETALRRGLELRSKLVTDFPKNLDYRLALARTYNDLGALREMQHNYAEAEENCRRSVDQLTKLVAEDSGQREYRFDLSHGLSNLGQIARKQSKNAESEKLFRQASKMQEELIHTGPATAKHRKWLAESYNGLGIALFELKRPEEAEKAFRQSLELRRKLSEDFPGTLDYRRDLANAVSDLGRFLSLQGKVAEAEAPYREALELREQIVKKSGQSPSPRYRYELAGDYHNVAYVLHTTHRSDDAKANWMRALAIWKQLVAAVPRSPDFDNGLAGTLCNLAVLHNEQKEFAAALLLLDQAQPRFKVALAARPEDADFREGYRDYLQALAQTRLGLTEHAAAATITDELVGFGFDPVKDNYIAAGLLSQCARVAGKDMKLTEARRRELSKSYADRAITSLRKAMDHGFKDAAKLAKDADFEPLRQRADFKKLVVEMRMNGKKSP